jgi:hypothetical protein
MSQEILRPNGVGILSEHSLNGATPGYACVDEVTSDDDTTYVYCSTNSSARTIRDLYALPSPTDIEPNDTINSVTVYIKSKYSGTSSAQQVTPCLNGGYATYEGTANNLTTSYADYSYTWTIFPSTASPWIYQNIVNLQIGVKSYVQKKNVQARTTQVWVVVDYTPGQSSSPSMSQSSSPSRSPSISASVSPSISQSVSESISPSVSESSSPSPSITPEEGSASRSPSISESISSSISSSASSSISSSLSESISPSLSESASNSISPSLSESISESVSESISPSESPSVPADKVYSKGIYETMPLNDDDLDIAYTGQEILDVSTKDDTRVGQAAYDQYTVHQYKDDVEEADGVSLEWEGQAHYPPSSSAVYLQIYNRVGGFWQTLDYDNTSAADTDFTLEASINGLTNYKDESNFISCRVFQEL